MRQYITRLGLVAALALGIAVAVAWVAVGTARSQPLDPEAIARAHLERNRPQYGLRPALDDLTLLQIKESPAAYHVRFQQAVQGIPVFGAFSTVNINKASGGVNLVLDRRAAAVTPAISSADLAPDEAIAIALAAVGAEKLRGAVSAEQVYFRVEKTYHLAWQVLLPALEPLGDWLVVVRADNGQVLLKQDLIRFDSGQVFDPNPVVTSGGSVPPPSDCDSAANAASLAPQYQARTLLGIQAGQNKLKGQYVDLTAPGIVGSVQPAGQADEPSRIYNYPCDDPRFEEVMVYYHVDAAQRKMQSLGFSGNSGILDGPIPAHAHFDPGAPAPGSPDLACNAYYSPVDAGLHFGDFPARCNNGFSTDTAEDGDWIIHEYGHAIQGYQVPGWSAGPPLEVEQANAMGEGFGDFLAAAITGNPCWSEWVNIGRTACAGQRGLRWLQNTNVYPADFEACPDDEEDGSEEEHCAGLVWGGALWDLVEALGNDQAARDLALTLVLDSHFYLDPRSTFAEAASAIRQADIDLFGGAHVSTIDSVFAGRGIVSTGPISDFPYVYLRIRHSWRGDLAVRLKVGDLSSPDCDLLLWIPDPSDDADDLEGTVDLTGTSCEPFLPPSVARPWRLEVQDFAALDVGTIEGFKVALSGTQHCVATDVPVSIPDNDGPVYSVVDCTTMVKPPGEISEATATPTVGLTATPTPTPTSTLTLGPTPTLAATPTATNTPPSAATATPTSTPRPTATPTRTPGCPDDSFEDNDWWRAAAPVALPFSQASLRVCPGDEDWFSFPLSVRDKVQIDALFSDAEGDIDIAVLDPVGGEVDLSQSITDNESIFFTATTTGTYAVAVWLFEDYGSIEGNSYGLQISALAAVFGDVNCDGTVNSIDAALVLQRDAGLVGPLPCENNADVNLDGEINSIDATLILQFSAGLLDSLPP